MNEITNLLSLDCNTFSLKYVDPSLILFYHVYINKVVTGIVV
jgi:hypothetical protein